MIDELPEGWAWTTLGEIVANSKAKAEPGERDDAPYLSLEHVEPGTSRILGHGHGREVKSVKNVFEAGDVLYGKLRPYLNKVCRPNFDGICSTDILVLKTSPAVAPDFLHRLLTTQPVVEFAVANSNGINLPRTSFESMSGLEIALPPRMEQRRIVAKIEELTARSRAARAALAEVPTLLEQFRQSVLASAFRGDLTADWRAKHPHAEPASELLARIRTERRKQWEAKYPKKKYVEPDPVDDSDLPELPEGWEWASIGELSSLVTSGSRGWAEFYSEDGSTFIRSQDINTDNLDLSQVARVRVPAGSEGERTKVERGDVLITITGANVGKCAEVCVLINDAYISQHVALIRLVRREVSSLLHLWASSTDHGRKMLLTDAYGNGKPGLNLDSIRELPVPLAPILEQDAFIREVRSQFQRLDAIEQWIADARESFSSLDQSILAKAFRGQLVPQDPADEPASVLLERLRAGQAAATTNGTPRRKGRR